MARGFRLALVALAFASGAILPGCLTPDEEPANDDSAGGAPVDDEFSEPTDGSDGNESAGDDAPARPSREWPLHPPADWSGSTGVRLAPIASSLHRPIGVADPDDGSGRLFILLKAGLILTWVEGNVLDEPFLNLTSRVQWGGEQGLFTLTFHPDFLENGRAFVSYTTHGNAVVVEEYRVDGERIDPTSARTLLRLEKEDTTHNGGTLAFGPDGFLYVSVGDGGGAGDPSDDAQRLDSLFGKVLRIDVDAGEPYAVPPDNPFVDEENARSEIWALGLRNPWRFSIDRATGDLWIGDVGQRELEEVSVAPAGVGGLNFGWSVFEGSKRFRDGEPAGEAVPPVHEYAHPSGCAVIGGHVYRGSELPWLIGSYVFSDLCAGTVWALAERDGEWERRDLVGEKLQVVSLGEDAWGELFVIDQQGTVYRITPQ